MNASAVGVRRPARLAARPADLFTVLRRLTPRDRLICATLAEHRVLTTDQLADLAFDAVSSAQHRLVILYRLGVLGRFRRYQPAGSQPWHYVLDHLGATLVAADAGVDPPSPAVVHARTVALAGSQRLDHLLGVNGFFTALAGHARASAGTAVLTAWWSERRCAREYGKLVRPDGYGVFSEHRRQLRFFLEYDTGTETLARVTGKLAGYADLAEADGHPTPVLFWLPGPRREAALRRALADVRTRVPVPVATATPTLGGGPAGPVWLPLGVDGPRRPLAGLGDGGR